jgi:hypothetical protein
MAKTRKIKYIVMLILISVIFATFTVKKAVYNLTRKIITVENRINELEQEKYMLQIEWAYLTSPERLAEIMKKVNTANNQQEQPTIISVKRIKKLDTLASYYYTKNKEINVVNPVASSR